MEDVTKEEIEKAVVDLATKYRLASKHTSFVGVDDKAAKGEFELAMNTRDIKNQVRKHVPLMTSHKFDPKLTYPSTLCYQTCLLHLHIPLHPMLHLQSPNLCDVIYECSLTNRFDNFFFS